jgi:hypothetical protein
VVCTVLLEVKSLIPMQLTYGRHNGYPKHVEVCKASNFSFKEGRSNENTG